MAALELGIDERWSRRSGAGAPASARCSGRRSAGSLLIVAAAAIFADLLPIPSPTDMDMLARRAAARGAHWLGTDGLGRDELARLIYGARISLTVGLCAPVIGVTIGGALGMLAGYFRGRFETVVVGGVDVLLAFPPLVLALAVTAYLGQSVAQPHLHPRHARHSRLHARGARRHADAGASANSSSPPRRSAQRHARILLRELLPNVALPLLAFFLLGVAVTIVVEGALSFLGLGVPPPMSSWGSMIGEGRESLEIAPRLAFIPAGRDVPDGAVLQSGRRHACGRSPIRVRARCDSAGAACRRGRVGRPADAARQSCARSTRSI